MADWGIGDSNIEGDITISYSPPNPTDIYLNVVKFVIIILCVLHFISI